jgi:hypothetical protein
MGCRRVGLRERGAGSISHPTDEGGFSEYNSKSLAGLCDLKTLTEFVLPQRMV